MISVSNLFRMQLIHFTAVTLCMSNVFAYHDPDLNYHLNQVQKLSNCDGYSYPAPSVQLTESAIKVAQQILPQPAYQYSSGTGYSAGGSEYVGSGSGYTTSAAGNTASADGYSGGLTYLAPKITYAQEPAATYQTSSLVPNYSTAPIYATKEAHGYTTSAGLSAQSSSQRTVTPLATYAQAPIIAKVTAAPLIARFTLAPGKNTYTVQNVISQQSVGSSAKASLNSYSNFQHGGPVVSQVFAAPSAGYATSPALRVQQPVQVLEQARYAAPTVAEYHKASAAANSARANQYVTSSVTHSAPATQYFSPVSQQYAPSAAQYSAPAIQYSAPATQYSGPGVLYSTPTVQYSAPALKYSAPEIQYSAPAVPQFSAPVSTQLTQQYNAPVNHFNALTISGPIANHVAASPIKKNVHTEFLENYDSHPRYAYEYSVNDPHTGDIKQQKEQRDGEVVKGQYSLVEPDGSVRTVNYVADWETGFHADVRNSKDNQH